MAMLKSPSEYQKEYQKFKKDKNKDKSEAPAAPAEEKKPSPHEPPKFEKKEDYEKEYVHLTLEVRPILIERIIWLTIIAALVIVIFYNPYSDYLDWKKGVITGEIKGTVQEVPAENSLGPADGTAGASAQQEALPPAEVTSQTAPEETEDTEPALDESNVVDTLTPEKDTVVVQNMKITADDVTLTIVDIIYEDKGSYAKVTGVKVRAATTGATLYPKFSAIVYDSETEQYDKDKVRGTAQFDIGITSSQELEITLDKPATFSNGLPVTVVVKLENSKTGDLLSRMTKQFDLDY